MSASVRKGGKCVLMGRVRRHGKRGQRGSESVAPRVFSCANWEETRPHTHIYLHIEKEILDEQTKSRPAFPRIHVGGEQVGKAEAALEDECGPFIA